MKNILIADDHAIVRMGVKSLILGQLPNVHIDEAGTEEQIIQHIKGSVYDLILLDVQIPGTDFTELMRWIVAASPEARVLVFTMHSEDIYGLRCIGLGAKGFLQKTAPDGEILFAIGKVLNGERYITASLAENMIGNQHNVLTQRNPFNSLSQREMEIVTHLDAGKRLAEICSIMSIQYSTANTYKRRVFDKLNIKNILSLSRMVQAYRLLLCYLFSNMTWFSLSLPTVC